MKRFERQSKKIPARGEADSISSDWVKKGKGSTLKCLQSFCHYMMYL